MSHKLSPGNRFQHYTGTIYTFQRICTIHPDTPAVALAPQVIGADELAVPILVLEREFLPYDRYSSNRSEQYEHLLRGIKDKSIPEDIIALHLAMLFPPAIAEAAA